MTANLKTATNMEKQQASSQAPATEKREKSPGYVEYEVAGQQVRLSYQIVRDFLTKGNGNVSDQDLVNFISICKYNLLNPFLNEAYLIKYGTSPATMIVSKEALMKRAEANPNYVGVQAGIIVIRDEQVLELEGSFHLPTDKLVGGWAKVYREDRKFPYVAKVNLSEYDSGQSNWKAKPATMISKVAKVQAMREAFPAQLGAMYTEEERIVDIPYEDVSEKVEKEKAGNANKQPVRMDDVNEIPKAWVPETKEVNKAKDPGKQTTGKIEGPGF